MLLEFLLAGEHRKVKRLGYVAEFCSACHEIRPFRLDKHGLEDRLLFIPLGMKSVTGHEATCTGCGTPRLANPATYAGVARKPGGDLESLVRQTFPEIRQIHAELLRMEKARADGSLTPADKEKLMTHVFVTFEKQVQDNFGDFMQARGPGVWMILLTVFAAVAGSILIQGDTMAEHQKREAALVILYGGFLAGLFLSVLLMILQPRRTFRRRILPAMARALVPLHPSRSELEEVVERMRKSGFKVGKKTRPETLLLEISRVAGPYGGFTSRETGSLRSH